jgi:hypothetical protein
MLLCAFKFFVLFVYDFPKDACHQDFNLFHTYYNCHTSLFWVKKMKAHYDDPLWDIFGFIIIVHIL